MKTLIDFKKEESIKQYSLLKDKLKKYKSIGKLLNYEK